ncbi:MAG: AraC family transcriptional regulator [Rikenellaceae bacterium]
MVPINESIFGFKYRVVKTHETMEQQRSHVNILTHNAIFFQLEGELSISWDEFKDVRIKAGELYFLPRGATVSACIVGEKIRYIAARLEHSLDNSAIFNDLFKDGTQSISYTFAPFPIEEPVAHFLDSIRCYIVNDMNMDRLQSIKFLELYILLQGCYSNEKLATLFYPVLKSGSKFKTFILDNYQVTVSIDELARRANMSRSTFDRTFKEHFGMTPHKWIDIQTTILIQRKASEPNVTVKDIMYEVGIYNSSQFTQLCRRLCGMTPTELIRN